MTSSLGKQTIAINVLPNTSRTKGNQAITFGQLIETRETFFFKNHAQHVVENLFPNPFLKNQNWGYLWVNSPKFYAVCFYWMLSLGLSKYTKLSCRPLAFTSYKKPKMYGACLPTSFFALFLNKNISFVIFYLRTKFHPLLAFTS